MCRAQHLLCEGIRGHDLVFTVDDNVAFTFVVVFELADDAFLLLLGEHVHFLAFGLFLEHPGVGKDLIG